MGGFDPKATGEPSETADDVASLFSWANLHGAKYRDFSASRAQARDEAKRRVEEALAAEARRKKEEEERRAQEEAQAALRRAAEAAEAARRAEAERLAEIAHQAEAERQAVLAAQEAARQAAQQRAQKAAAALVPVSPFAEQQAPAASYSEPVTGRMSSPDAREPGSVRMVASVPAPAVSEPVAMPSPMAPEPVFQAPWMQPETNESFVRPAWLTPDPAAYLREPAVRRETAAAPPVEPPVAARAPQPASEPVPQAPVWTPLPIAGRPVSTGAPASYASPAQYGNPVPAPNFGQGYGYAQVPEARPAAQPQAQPVYTGNFGSGYADARGPVQPPVSLWAQGNPAATARVAEQPPVAAQMPQPPMAHAQAAVGEETGSDKRERGGNHWFAMKSLFDSRVQATEPAQAQSVAKTPVLSVFSLAGGVGKTSLVASLGRALSSRGERVVLVDTAAFGLLPFYFGARDQRPGVLRTFNPPGSSIDAPVQLLALDPETQKVEGNGEDSLTREIVRDAQGASRILVDLPTASGATTRRILRLNAAVLVPVIPDMNSVVSVGAIESFFRNQSSVTGHQAMPYYVLNQFDTTQPLHLDVREMLREQLGDRLLPIVIRRSPAVSEALAEGMTVIDYAPNGPVTEDYANLAGWVRSLAAPANPVPRGIRWSER